jgi:hypothetical protein
MLNYIDVIFLGLRNDPLFSHLVHFLSSLPKFRNSTPIPHTKSQLQTLHEDNLLRITSFLCRHNLSVPSQISEIVPRPRKPLMSQAEFFRRTASLSPWANLKSFLSASNLLLTPADKIHHFVIWLLSTYLSEFNIHV